MACPSAKEEVASAVVASAAEIMCFMSEFFLLFDKQNPQKRLGFR